MIVVDTVISTNIHNFMDVIVYVKIEPAVLEGF